ncbi:MAG: Carbohydrate kinase, YjeF related protein [Microgenomates group bacterium GW2011_GWC1_37_12b]|uniref:ADP-dependent (S)-NAD(P)H-hydrate dehydratase n=2 Tax=Candidatus Woeseibacteriota TaxID=1752722 RepID=A0A0G0PE50_9BACT|nr:MAG: Carbohydrate kinase, YjeF related protein [Microgenomates group bacterium GW2011_GWC1_37_12b]KKQ87566.1 MAG: Carbohydrate kinase, YjeF related protein [Candidatus Woesebacteria bacterium GW2011_GWB1_38_8b]
MGLQIMKEFKKEELTKLFRPHDNSNGEDNGQITIIGGSELFHGAPILALKTASRIVDMVFFATPEKSVGMVAELIKSKLMSFIWIPWDDLSAYIEKSDAILIGPGFMRFGSEKTPESDRHFDNHNEGKTTREITEKLLKKFPLKKWVIDAGSLQTMDAEWIPENAIITPNKKEFETLFGAKFSTGLATEMAKKYKCIIVAKGPESYVTSADETVLIKGGNAGMTKGGTGDILAGLTVALLAKNEPFLSACAASYIEKAAADELYCGYQEDHGLQPVDELSSDMSSSLGKPRSSGRGGRHKKVGTNYNADDLADFIPEYFKMVLAD